MPKKRNADSKRTKTRGQKIVSPNAYLETQKAHDEWYNIHTMGKQRGMPRLAPREVKKAAGRKKHELRKEK